MEVADTNDRVLVKVHVPGVSKDNLHVDITDDALTLRGELHEEEKKEEKRFHRREFRYGAFARTIQRLQPRPSRSMMERILKGRDVMADTDRPQAPDDEDTDSCLCGMSHNEQDATSDEDLPPASGGIARAANAPGTDETDLDGCDVDFTQDQQTGDADLPAATGGM